MTNRELLQLAAKAAGYKVRWHDAWKCFVHTVPQNTDDPPTIAGQRLTWIPFDDDGDALRLAVTLGLSVGPECPDVIGKSLCRVSWANRKHSLGEYGGGNKFTATRRAIVRAAAEIGKGMK